MLPTAHAAAAPRTKALTRPLAGSLSGRLRSVPFVAAAGPYEGARATLRAAGARMEDRWATGPSLLTCLAGLGVAAAAGWGAARRRSSGPRRLGGVATVPAIHLEAPARSWRLSPLAASSDSTPDPDRQEAPVQPPPTPAKDDAPLTAPPGEDEFGYLKYNDPLAATSRFIGRRFGLAGGLAFVGIFAAVEGNEILQALLEPPVQEGTGDVVTLPSGVQYVDVKVGGGRVEPQAGFLVGAKFKVVTAGGELVYDSEGAKPLAFKYGERPLVGLICLGVEEGIRGMRVGGVRRITVPPALGFGDQPKVLRPDYTLPPGTTLIYQIEVVDIVPLYF